MGQRLLIWLFRASAIPLVLAGLLSLGAWKLGTELFRAQSGFWAGPILQFFFNLGITWLLAGVVAPLLLWSIRHRATADVPDAARTSDTGGLTSLMPIFLALAALLAAAASGPLLTGWKEGLALIERFDLWQTLEQGGEGLLALLPVAAVLFVPALGSTITLSFLAGTATAFTFREKGSRFLRIYAAWLVIHAALVLAAVYSNNLQSELSGPWLDQVRAEAAAPAPDGSGETIPPGALAYLEDWVPAAVDRTATLATRWTWISVVYAAWIPLLLVAWRERFRLPKRLDGRRR